MTVENSVVIDAIGLDKSSGAAHLTIADHLQWDDVHLLLLQDKLNSYLGVIESDEIYDSYPAARGKALIIDIVAKYRPTPKAMKFLQHADVVAGTYGASVRYRHAGTGYADDVA